VRAYFRLQMAMEGRARYEGTRCNAALISLKYALLGKAQLGVTSVSRSSNVWLSSYPTCLSIDSNIRSSGYRRSTRRVDKYLDTLFFPRHSVAADPIFHLHTLLNDVPSPQSDDPPRRVVRICCRKQADLHDTRSMFDNHR